MAKTFGWLVLLERHGFVNWSLCHLGVLAGPAHMLFTSGAVLCGMVHALLPIFVLAVVPVMESIDNQFSKAAETLGASPGTRFWEIYFPLTAPGFMSGFLLVFVSASSFFIVPELLGSPSQTMLSQMIITEVLQLLNWRFAAALSVILIVCVGVTYSVLTMIGRSLFPHDRYAGSKALRGHGRSLLGRVGKVFNPLLLLIDKNKGVETCLHMLSRWGVIVFLILPLLVLLPISLTRSDFLGWPPQFLSFRWYTHIIRSPVWIGAIERSLSVAFFSGCLATVLGACAAMGIVRSRTSVAGLLLSVLLLPLVLPRITVAVALYQFLTPLGLVGTDMGLTLGHTLIALPYCVVTLVGVFKLYDRQFEQAAATLGAGWTARFFHVVLPQLRPGLIAAFLFAFAISFDELTIAMFVSGGVKTTLPKLMWDNAVLAVDPTLAAASTTLVLGMGALVTIATVLTSSSRRKTGSS
ncbi:ABC transporter permease subunit [Gluconobacter cerinus]|nr:ABC transporter permease subunit [Gluconobacter cerinus]